MYKTYLGGDLYDKFECEVFHSDFPVTHPESWKVRPCEWYKEEYNNCKNFFQRFNQRFIFGKGLDCSQWKTDYDNCNTFRNTQDEMYMLKVIESENKRIKKRIDGSKGNDVWEYRTSPPPNWTRRLPDWWYEKTDNSHLAKYQQKLEKERINSKKSE